MDGRIASHATLLVVPIPSFSIIPVRVAEIQQRHVPGAGDSFL
ncbi:hypothetical protein ACVJBD_002840 [Rhizobium mongolense]